MISQEVYDRYLGEFHEMLDDDCTPFEFIIMDGQHFKITMSEALVNSNIRVDIDGESRWLCDVLFEQWCELMGYLGEDQ